MNDNKLYSVFWSLFFSAIVIVTLILCFFLSNDSFSNHVDSCSRACSSLVVSDGTPKMVAEESCLISCLGHERKTEHGDK